jgi:hypothetical protein
MCGLEITVRCDANASQIIKINIISATNDIRDPMEEIVFHFVNASG